MTTNEFKFSGTVVSIGTANDTLGIESPTFEERRGKLWVTGTMPKGSTTNDWAAGRPCAVAWEAVTEFIEFDDAEQYQQGMDKSRK